MIDAVSRPESALHLDASAVCEQAGKDDDSARQEGSYAPPQSGEARRVARGAEEAPGEREGIHPDARSAEPGAARSPLGARREAVLFEGEHGKQTLNDLFEGRGQLVIYHAMFNPDTAGPHTPWTPDAPCYVCSFWMDNFNGITVHLNHRDITMAAVSRAPYVKLATYKRRIGWGFPWGSSLGGDFNFDYRVSFTDAEMKAGKIDYNYRLEPWSISEGPGISVFLKDGGQIYHTYSTYARGLDMLNVAYHYMDLVPKGRERTPAARCVGSPSRRVSGLMTAAGSSRRSGSSSKRGQADSAACPVDEGPRRQRGSCPSPRWPRWSFSPWPAWHGPPWSTIRAPWPEWTWASTRSRPSP